MKYKSIRIDAETYDKLNELACKNGRSIIGQLRWMFEHQWTVNNASNLHPLPDCEPTPIYDVKGKQS